MEEFLKNSNELLEKFQMEVLSAPVESPVIKMKNSQLVKAIIKHVRPSTFFPEIQKFVQSKPIFSRENHAFYTSESATRVRLAFAALLTTYSGHWSIKSREMHVPREYSFEDWYQWFKNMPQISIIKKCDVGKRPHYKSKK